METTGYDKDSLDYLSEARSVQDAILSSLMRSLIMYSESLTYFSGRRFCWKENWQIEEPVRSGLPLRPLIVDEIRVQASVLAASADFSVTFKVPRIRSRHGKNKSSCYEERIICMMI